MVSIIEEKNNYSDDRINQKVFLNSLNKWHKDEGILIGIEKVYEKDKMNKYGKHEHMFTLKCSILEDMPKCWARVLDNEGKVVIKKNEFSGEPEEQLEVVDDADRVTLFMKVNYTDNIEDYKGDDELLVSKNAGVYHMVKPILVAEGLIDDSVNSSISFNVDEILDKLQGLEFICKAGKNKNGRFIPVFEIDE